MDYIDKHITDNITLSDVARTIGYSSKYLSEVFAKETDTTFKSYVMDKKLEVAKSLLLNPKNSILDICDYLGFCNQSYFSKMFKKNTGSSPSAFIKHHR
jgi:two-component system response regulator YesN